MEEEIAHSWTALLESLGPVAIFLCAATNAIIGQPPTGVTYTFVGWATTEGTISIPMVIVCWTFGYTIGSLAWFQLLARKGRDWVERVLVRLGRDPAIFDRAERWFERWGAWAVFMARLVPGVGWSITIPAGLSGMRWTGFTLATFVGASIWGTFWTLLARAAGEELEAHIDTFQHFWRPSLAVVAVGVLAYVLIRRVWRRRAGSAGGGEDGPRQGDDPRDGSDQ